jgi:hypothetical protein
MRPTDRDQIARVWTEDPALCFAQVRRWPCSSPSLAVLKSAVDRAQVRRWPCSSSSLVVLKSAVNNSHACAVPQTFRQFARALNLTRQFACVRSASNIPAIRTRAESHTAIRAQCLIHSGNSHAANSNTPAILTQLRLQTFSKYSRVLRISLVLFSFPVRSLTDSRYPITCR